MIIFFQQYYRNISLCNYWDDKAEQRHFCNMWGKLIKVASSATSVVLTVTAELYFMDVYFQVTGVVFLSQIASTSSQEKAHWKCHHWSPRQHIWRKLGLWKVTVQPSRARTWCTPCLPLRYVRLATLRERTLWPEPLPPQIKLISVGWSITQLDKMMILNQAFYEQ